MAGLKPLLIEADESDDLLQARKRRTEIFLFAALLALALLAANLAYGTFLRTRHDRSFCLNCHASRTPPAMWVPTGRHSAGFSCSPCHGAPPGLQGRRGAFSARLDTVNPNCVGCHREITAGREIPKAVEVRVENSLGNLKEETVYRWGLQDLMYQWHVRNQVCVCTDCHRNIAHDKEAGAVHRSRPRLAYCGECHYHAAKDPYVNLVPLPELELVDTAQVQPAVPGPSAGLTTAVAEPQENSAASWISLALADTLVSARPPGPSDSQVPASPAVNSLVKPAANSRIYATIPRVYHRKGQELVSNTGKECRECHVAGLYPWRDFFGWEFRWKWQVHWLLFSGAAFVALIGIYVSVQFWRRGERASLHHPVHWPSVAEAVYREELLGSRIYRHSRLRWSIFFLISIAFLALAAVFVLTLVFRFLIPDTVVASWAVPVLDFLADLLGGMITVGVLLALYRRTLGRPPHLKSEPEDFAILLLILGVVLTGFFLEGCRLAVVSQEPRIWVSFIGASWAQVLRTWDLSWTAVRFYGWVLHAILVFALLAYLPFSKLFHLITSPISIAATASEAHYRQHQ